MTLGPLEQAFIDDCPYAPGGQLIDSLLVVDLEKSLIRVRMPTHDQLPITSEQRVHPVRHPRHVSGGLMVHMTGIAGFVHAYYVLGLRHHEGWIGYGARIHAARFHALAPPGEPLLWECTATTTRRSAAKVLCRYQFRATQNTTLVYEGDQTALWMKVGAKPPS